MQNWTQVRIEWVASVTVGLNASGAGGGLSSTSSAVGSNYVLAYGYGNTASNMLNLSALSSGANQASAAIQNSQFNSAAISATVTTANIGVTGGFASGGSIVVNGNASTAQAIGNSVVNSIRAK